MTIIQLLAMPIGEKVGGGFPMAIKTFKKSWQVNKRWIQQIILMDETGEMPADVNLGLHCNTLRGKIGKEIRVVVAEIQNAEYLGNDRKKLYIDQYDYDSWVGEPPSEAEEWQEMRTNEIKGKIRHGLSCSLMQTTSTNDLPTSPTAELKKIILEWQEFIMTGE